MNFVNLRQVTFFFDLTVLALLDFKVSPDFVDKRHSVEEVSGRASAWAVVSNIFAAGKALSLVKAHR